MTADGYALPVGDDDGERLALLGRFYDPNSEAFLEAAGGAEGDSIVDVGCGHRGVTDRMAHRVGATGTVYAVDASADQLWVARAALTHHSTITFVESARRRRSIARQTRGLSVQSVPADARAGP